MLSTGLKESPVIFFVLSQFFNAYVELVFSQMKHLFNDRRNSMTTELVSAELKLPYHALRCINIYYINQDLLKAIGSNEKYTFKRKQSR
jgi:hypothetical protein